MRDFRKLRVWERAQATCVEVYVFSAGLPADERFGMRSQLRRAAVSVGANLAEGSKRTSRIDKARIYNIAQGEAAEAMSILDVAYRLNYGSQGRAEQLSRVYEELIGQIERLRQDVLSEVEQG